MKLDDMRQTKKTITALKVLKENFGMTFNVYGLNYLQTTNMLNKIKALIAETRQSTTRHVSHKSPAYVKLLMLEQALSGHLSDLRYRSRIIVENQTVQQAEVTLAAQSLIDDIQKMLEQVSKMNVEELPAVVDGIANEIGSNQSEQFNEKVGTALNTLQQALSSAKKEVQSALSSISSGSDMDMENLPGDEDAELPAEIPDEQEFSDETGEMPSLPELPEEPEEPEEPRNTGRERR